jgi:hypothetical protein
MSLSTRRFRTLSLRLEVDMNEITVRSYSDESNQVVIQTPGRNFPGTVIQGDQLRSLLRSTQRALALIEANEYEDAAEELKDLEDRLLERCLHYELVLRNHKLELPYPDQVTANTSGKSQSAGEAAS